MSEGSEPEKLDKDCGSRDYVKKNCDPYNDPIPEIPSEFEKVTNVYQDYYNIFEIENKDNMKK